MSNNKQSSLDILLKELEEIGVLNIKNCHWSDEVDVKKAIEQAKAMHKDEMCEFAFKVGRGQDYDDEQVRELAEIIYNETFGK